MKLKPLLLLLFVGASLAAQSSFLPIPDPSKIPQRGTTTPITASIGYQGYDESQSYFGQGEFEIFLDFTDGILDKPIIVLDGFDPGDQRDITGLYNSFNFDGDNLADIVRSEGFDIVILNAPQYTTGGKDIDGGSDYIQRNALVLVEMINYLNAEKVGDEELVILGPSMGGLIARYALAYMESVSLEHETRLYISFDSPHLGANIPISLQYLINYLAQELGDPDAQAIVENVLNSPAAKEMLIDHLLGHLLSGSTYEQDPTLLLPIGAPNFRDAFQTELDNLGFPENVRNVAMINGSALGSTTGTPGMQVVNTTLDITSTISADVILRFTPAASQTNTVTDFQTYFIGIPAGSFTADAESFAFTDGVDSAPGGTSNISSALGDGTNPVIVAFIDALEQDDYNFIPTLSALAIENEDDWFATPDIGGIHNSAFVNTFIPLENEPHVQVTADNVQFALDEIRQTVLDISEVSTHSKFELLQNPTSGTITILMSESVAVEDIDIRGFTMGGQEIELGKIAMEGSAIAIKTSLSSGIYMLRIQDGASVETLKVVIR